MTDGGVGAFERRIVSVLFADLVGFTTLGERLDPEDVAAIQDRYFAAVRETAGRYGGRLEKFIGDAAVAAFGVPVARDDDAERAVRAGLAIVGAVERLGSEIGLEPGELAVRVGIATGEVVHAESGPDEGRLTGDTMNTAARLQAAAPSGGVLVGESTALAVAEAIDLAPLEAIALKGKAEPVRVAVVLGVRPERSREAAMGGLRAETIGREGELATLIDAAARVRASRRGERWLVVAPPGTGKTRLLDELGRRVASEGVVVRRARFRADDPRPFGALADLTDGIDLSQLRERLRERGASAARADVVVGLVRMLRGDGLADASSSDRDAQFGAWIEALDASTVGDTEVWLIEDAHWAGPDALAFFDLAGAASATPRLLTAATRPSLLERDPGWTAIDPAAGRHRVDLPGLGSVDAAVLVRALVGDGLPADLVSRIAEASDGNCLFIEELLRTWVSVGLLRHRGDGWVLTAAPDAVAIPSTVFAVYGAQLDDLPPEARMVARRAAVAGRRFPVQALPDLGAAEPEAALESLDRRALIDGPSATPLLGPAYVYRHALLRDAAYASLARAERASLHVALARWLEATAGAAADEVAEAIGHHYEAALVEAPALATSVGHGLDRPGATELAAAWLERAARHAERQGAFAAAADLVRGSLAATPGTAPLALGRRNVLLAQNLREVGEMDAAASALEAAIAGARVARASGEPDSDKARSAEARSLLATAGSRLSDLRYEQLAFQTAWDLAEGFLAEAGGGDDAATAVLILSRGRARAGETNETSPWIADADRALAIAGAIGDPRLELDARAEAASARAEAGAGQAEDWLPVVELARAMGDHGLEARAIVNAASFILDERPLELRPAIAPARDIAEAYGLSERLGWIGFVTTEADLATGAWDSGVREGLATLELAEAHGFHRVAVRTISCLAPMSALRGDVAALTHAQRWYETARGRSLPMSPYGRVLHAAAESWFQRGGLETHDLPDPDDLAEGLAMEPSAPSWMACLAVIFGAWRAAGMVEPVRDAIEASTRALYGSGTPSRLARGALILERAVLAETLGDPDTAVVQALNALPVLRGIGAAWWVARAIRVLERAGRADPSDLADRMAIEAALGVRDPVL